MRNSVRLPSGRRGWRGRLREVYDSLEEFTGYAETYGLLERLGYADAATAWNENPLIEGSSNPEDFARTDLTMRRKTFRSATFVTRGTTFQLEAAYQSSFRGLLFTHLTLEEVRGGRCIHRLSIYPWQYKFNMLAMMRGARQLCLGEKTNHVKS